MISILAVLFFVLGLIIGSFLNVVIFRLNTQKTLGGRSACMSCLNKLSWYELIPVFSFLGLKGRCKSCKTKISMQYPLVEFVSGLIFALLFVKFSPIGWLTFLSKDILLFSISYAYYAAIFSLLLIISVYDIRHKIIPDILSFTFGLLAFLGLFLFKDHIFYLHIPTMLELFSGALIALPFALLWFVSGGRWMGFGDAKLALGIGWLLGLTSAFSALVIAFWSGAIIGVALIIFERGKYSMKSELPFAPYLVASTFIVFIFSFNIFQCLAAFM